LGTSQSPFCQVSGHPPFIATPNHNNSRGGSRLKQLMAADVEPVTSLGHDGLEANAGTGGHEIRT